MAGFVIRSEGVVVQRTTTFSKCGCPHDFLVVRMPLGFSQSGSWLSLILERVIFCHRQTTFLYGSVLLLVPRPILLSTYDEQLSV